MTKPCPHCNGTGLTLDQKAMGSKMRGLREKAGVSGRDIAHRLGYSASYISDLELGRRNWSSEKIADYKEALKEKR